MNLFEFCHQRNNSAYEYECERQKILDSKTDYLFKWLTLIVSVIGIVVPVITKSETDLSQSKGFLWLYIITMIMYVGAMILVLLVSFPRKIKLYRSGSEWLKIARDLQKSGNNLPQKDDIDIMKEFDYKRILEEDIIIKKIRKKNNKVAYMIMAADICIIAGLIVTAILFMYLIWGV